MKRRLAMLLTVVGMAAAVGLFSPVAPASADTDLCVGQGTATTGTDFRLLFPDPTGTLGLAAPTVAPFNFNLLGVGIGICLSKQSGLTAAGTVSGWCGLSSGWGSAINGHDFSWVGIGSLLVLTGELIGVVNAVPNVLGGQSCAQPGAKQFLVTGAVVLLDCMTTPPLGSGPGIMNPVNGTNIPITVTGMTIYTHLCA